MISHGAQAMLVACAASESLAPAVVPAPACAWPQGAAASEPLNEPPPPLQAAAAALCGDTGAAA